MKAEAEWCRWYTTAFTLHTAEAGDGDPLPFHHHFVIVVVLIITDKMSVFITAFNNIKVRLINSPQISPLIITAVYCGIHCTI